MGTSTSSVPAQLWVSSEDTGCQPAVEVERQVRRHAARDEAAEHERAAVQRHCRSGMRNGERHVSS
jgi:hypothetical protein